MPPETSQRRRERPATLADLGEREVIRRLARRVGRGRQVSVGIGDDCAVVRIPGSPDDWVLTTDPVIEGVHFLAGTRGRRVGHKAAGRVLSDIASMGGDPRWVLVDLVAPPAMPMAYLEEVYRGATALCARHGAAIIGGDLAKGPRLELHLFAVGSVPKGRALLRSGARPGDALYVTGALGGSLLGRHLDFEPRVAEGAWLRAGRWATAMMDVSDGLAADLRRLTAESGVGADLRAEALPVSAAARRMRDGLGPLAHALTDGEDFELLFTVPAARAAAFDRAWRRRFDLRCTAIGTITRRRGAIGILDGRTRRPLSEDGYQHFVS